MKRTLTVIAATLLAATTVFAQPRGGAPAGPPAGPGGPAIGGPSLVDYLQLTADQKTAWTAAHQAFEDSTQTTRDQIKTAQEQLKALMDAKSTDAAAIGTIMITIRTLSDQIRTAHDALDAKLASILTAEQNAKYAAFQAALEFLRQHNGPPAGGPGGPGGN